MANREMKYSGVEWIGDIPIHWKLVSVKHLFIIGRGRVIAKTELDDNGDYPVYSSQTKNNGVLGFIDTYDYDVSQLTWTTDGANAGTVFLREGKYNCTNVCGTLLPKISNMSMKYMKYALEYIAIFHKRADTNGFKIMNNEMAVIKTLLPLEKEQQKIAAFLDEKTSHIDNIIENTKKSIENLKAYKQSLITETVTKGLDSNVEMKDSGIEWIGEIPSHWDTVKMKRLGNIRNGLTYKPIDIVDSEEGILVLRSGNIQNSQLSFQDNVHVKKEINPDLIVSKGDILICSRNGSRKLIGKNAIIEDDLKATFGAFMMLFRPNELPKYIYYILNSEVFNFYLGTFLTSTINQLTKGNFENMKIVFCPDTDEQGKIVAFLDDKVDKLNSMIQDKENLLNEFESYKKSLIYEYVTGKKEVK